MAEPVGNCSISSAARARNSRLYGATGGQPLPSERAVAHPASKLVAITRTARRCFQLVMLHLDVPTQAFDALRIPPGFTGAEQDRGDSADDCEEPRELEGIGGQKSADDRDHRSPRRRSSMRAQTM